MPYLTPEEMAEMERAAAMAQRAKTYTPSSPVVAAMLSQYATQYPGISPGLAYAVARSSAPQALVERAWQAELANKTGTPEPGTRIRARVPKNIESLRQAERDGLFDTLTKKQARRLEGRLQDRFSDTYFGDSALGAVGRGLNAATGAVRDVVGPVVDPVVKPVVRNAALGLQAGWETVVASQRAQRGTTTGALLAQQTETLGGPAASPQARAFGVFGAPTEQNPDWTSLRDVAEQTTLYHVLDGKSVGDGYLPDFHSPAGIAQAAAAREHSPYLVGGSAWTPGRAFAGAVFEPDSDAFNLFSGAVDAGLALSRLDPASAFLSTVAKARAANKLFASADEIAGFGAVRGVRARLLPQAPETWAAGSQGTKFFRAVATETDPRIISEATGIKDIRLAGALARTTTPDEAKDVFLASTRTIAGNNIPTYRRPRGTSIFAPVPKGVGDLDDLDGLARLGDAHLVNAKATDAQRSAAYKGWVDAAKIADSGLDPRGANMAAVKNYFNILSDTLTAHGVDRAVANEWSSFQRGIVEGANAYYGNAILDGVAHEPQFLAIGDDMVSIQAPILDIDQIHTKIYFPDQRDVRRAVSGFSGVVNNQVWKSGVTALDAGMVPWKRMMLTRPAWGLRVIAEEQLRIAAHGMTSMVNHPLSHVAWMLGNPESRVQDFLKGIEGSIGARTVIGAVAGATVAGVASDGDLETTLAGAVTGGLLARTRVGEKVIGKGGEITASGIAKIEEHFARGGYDALGIAFGDDINEGLYQRFQTMGGGYAHREFVPVARGEELHARGVGELLIRYRESPEVRGLLAADNLDAAKAWWWNGAGQNMRKSMSYNPRFAAMANIGPDAEAASGRYVEEAFAAIRGAVGDSPELLDALRTGKLGDISLLAKGGKYRLSDDAEEAVKRLTEAGIGPDKVPLRKVIHLSNSDKAQHLVAAKEAFNWLFDALMPRPSNYFSRNPTLRQSYWNRYDTLIAELGETDRATLIANARKAKLGRETINSLEAKHARLSAMGDALEPRLTLAEADLLAKRHAIDSTKALLYDLSDRSRFFEITRLIFPFGDAWKEVLSTWTKIVREQPQAVRRGMQVIQGARSEGSSVIGDATGSSQSHTFFYTDEFGQEVFGFPGSEFFTKATVGIPIPLKSPVAGLNMVGQGLPGLGFVAQIPLAYALPNKPSTDWISQQLFPFGRPDPELGAAVAEGFAPAWLKKVYAGVFQSPESSRLYADAMVSTMKYHASTGKFDLQGPNAREELLRLLDVSKHDAKKFTIIRGLAQTTLPSAPSPEWLIHDKSGKLTLAWRAADWLRNRAEKLDGDWDTAYEDFLDRWGVANFLAPASKSRSVVSGGATTTSAYDWSRDHPALVKKYPEVYGLFAPQAASDESDRDTYEAAFDRGERVRLTSKEILESANARLARLAYTHYKTQFGTKITAHEQTELRQFRRDLYSDFPGYNSEAVDFNRTDRMIAQLQDAAKDRVLRRTDAGRGLTAYLAKRDEAIAALDKRNITFAAKDAAKTATWLDGHARYIISQHPDFEVMYDLVFSREFEQ